MIRQVIDRNISRQRLTQMLRRRSAETAVAEPKSEAPLFNWSCPHHFASHVWKQVQELGARMAFAVENAIGPLCLEAPKVTLKKIAQDFAYVLVKQTQNKEKPQYILPFAVQNKRPEGFLNVQQEAAMVLIAQMLRDPEASVGQNGVLSSVEESILQDASTVITDVMISVLQENGQIALKRSDRLISGEWPLEARQLQDMCGFAFELAFPKKKIEIRMMAVGEVLDTALGIMSGPHKPLSPAELSKKISRQLHDVPVTVTAQLCVTSIRMEDLVALEPGDVLIIDKKVTEPAEALLNGRLCFQAWPAICEGKLSLVMSHVKK